MVLLFLLSCSLFNSENIERLSNEEHAILSTVLDSMMRGQTLETIDVYDQTSTQISIYSLSIAFDQDSVGSSALLNNYNLANQICYELDMDNLPNYVMLKDTDESETYSDYYSFSCPGISEDGNTAVVECSLMSAPLAGCGMAYLLEKIDDNWMIIWNSVIWIS